MEASIRSSAPKALNVRFTKTEPALHEATQRFVESHMRDVRVSQFADLSYASTLLQKGTWYWLSGSQGKSGFLAMAPKSPVVWLDEQGKVSYKINMRVSKEWSERGSVFLASLNMNDGILRLEDLRFASGKSIEGDVFSKRWDALLDFYRNSYIHDSLLQGGLTIEPATYSSLDSAAGWQDPPMYMIAQGETFKKRVRVQVRDKDRTPIVERVYPPTREPSQLVRQKVRPGAPRPPGERPHAHAHAHARIQTPQPPVKHEQIQGLSSPKASGHELDAYVVPSKDFPDTYVLFVKGESKGFAAVQGLSLSRSLREASKTSEKIPVSVTWNAEFSSHEIVSIA
jgi:hypothetical protein